MNGWMPVADFTHGIVNVPAIVVALAVTSLLVVGTTESATVNAALVASRTVLRPSAMRFLIARDIEPPLRLGQRDDTLGKVEAGARITGQPGQNPRSAQYQTAPRITPTGGNTYR